jgi:hypothetical protein
LPLFTGKDGRREVSVTRREQVEVALRHALLGAVCAVVAYLSTLAAFHIDPPIWFGRPDSSWTILIVATMLTALCVLSYRATTRERPGAIPGGVIAILATASAVLALSSYLRCHDKKHPPIFNALVWTVGTVRGNSNDYTLSDGSKCPWPTPAALEIARPAGQFVLYVSVITILIALLATEVDRAWIRLARHVTTIVDVDDDSRSMVSAVAGTLANEKRTDLALIVAQNQVNAVRDLRSQGARIVVAELDKLDRLELLPLWRKTRQVYLLSASPTTNLRRLATIEQRLRALPGRRLPLGVRIDDPWQAASWRSQRLGGSDTLWAADAVGIYETTAARLVDLIVGIGRITLVAVVGTSLLTVALCADLARRQLERSFHSAPGAAPLPKLTIVANNAEEYRKDIDFHHRQRGFPGTDEWLAAVNGAPSQASLTTLIKDEKYAQDGGPPKAAQDLRLPSDQEPAPQPGEQEEVEDPTVAVIFAMPPGQGGADAMLGTRLAARFPTMPIFVLDPKADESQDTLGPIVGQLRTFRPAMEASGHGHDTWERAAMLIHEHWAAQAAEDSESTKPWAQLSEFYRGSNRRLVRNMLRMVEEIAGHTWDTFGGMPGQPASAASAEVPPLEQLAAIGFDRHTAMAMAMAEHEDWVRYLQRWGWRHGPSRDNEHKKRPDLVPWQTLIKENPDAVEVALKNLASTLYSLRALGFRSRPVWQHYRRTGTVTATRHAKPWSWTTAAGEPMRAHAGDWEVRDPDGRTWTIGNRVFRASYEHVDGNLWRRTGCCRARPARDGETVDTLEGRTVATGFDWVVEGTAGERWLVPPDAFARHYRQVESDESPLSVESS